VIEQQPATLSKEFEPNSGNVIKANAAYYATHNKVNGKYSATVRTVIEEQSAN
jgi:hypothetical protein